MRSRSALDGRREGCRRLAAQAKFGMYVKAAARVQLLEDSRLDIWLFMACGCGQRTPNASQRAYIQEEGADMGIARGDHEGRKQVRFGIRKVEVPSRFVTSPRTVDGTLNSILRFRPKKPPRIIP